MKTLLLFIYLFSLQVSPIIIIDLPEGELAWTTERPKNAKMCIPAAFTDLEGNVEGEYRLNGKIFNPNKRLKVSISNGMFYIDRKWHSYNGFQQLSLVYNNRARTFKDSRKFIRRALCKKGDKVFLVQSRHRMTLTEFAAECAKVSSNAVYLDMGEYGYRERVWPNDSINPDELICRFFTRNKRTIPIQLNDEIKQGYKQYGLFQFGMDVPDGICLTDQYYEGGDISMTEDNSNKVYVVIYRTIIGKSLLSKGQANAIKIERKEYVRDHYLEPVRKAYMKRLQNLPAHFYTSISQ